MRRQRRRDVVEQHEHGLGIAERESVRPELALPSLARVVPVGRLEIEVVVAPDIVPGQADRPDEAVVAVIERQVVEHEVADRDAEAGPGVLDDAHQVVADEVELGLGLGLRVGDEQHVEPLGFRLAPEAEIDRGGQGAGGFDPREGEAQRDGRAAGLVDVVEFRQHRHRVERRHIARRLDDEDHALVVDRKRVAPVRIGDGHLAAVRHKHSCDAGPFGTARAVVEDEARHHRDDRSHGLGGRLRRPAEGQRSAAGSGDLQHVAPRHPPIVLVLHASSPALRTPEPRRAT